jgi:hypothetical protein
MTFDIRFISRTAGQRPIRSGESTGQITLGDFKERFHSDLSYWSPKDYEVQWREAIERVTDGESCSALITSLADPVSSDALIWWPVYRVGSEVYVRNGILFFDQLPRKFDVTDPYASVPERCYSSGEEYEPSEWPIRLDELKEFLYRTAKK